MVTVLAQSIQTETDFEEEWLHAVAADDAFAFLADPSKEIYTFEDSEPFNRAGTKFAT